MTGSRPPRATYRLQLRPGFGFDDARAIVPYLARLGVSHLYLSPITHAAAASEHGYDVADPTRVSDDLGGEAGFADLVAAAHQEEMGILLDVVPNHMVTDTGRNRWWRDVLEDGEQSPFSAFFDIDWETPDAELRGRILVPVLAVQLPAVAAAGELRLVRCGGDVEVRHHDHVLPVAISSLTVLLDEAATASGSADLAALARDAAGLPPGGDDAARETRLAARDALHARLDAVCEADGTAATALDRVLAAAAEPARILDLCARQAWLLADWHEASHRLDHRRFFTIASLVGVRVEAPRVFAAVHERVVALVGQGAVDGLRVDHIDGLRDPHGHLERLAAATDGAWTVVEKILERSERLPAGWRAAGTTGYEFAALLARLSVDAAGVRRLGALRDELAGPAPPFAQAVSDAKREVVEADLRADVERLVRALRRSGVDDPELVAATDDSLRAVVSGLLVGLPVYRTYVDPLNGGASDADRDAVRRAVAAAPAALPGVDPGLIERVAGLLCGRGWDAAGRAAEFVARFQQLSPAVTAKGVEDTALYRDTAVLALCDVGCAPDAPPADPGELHHWCGEAAMSSPLGLLATSTHDSKRSEDVRARLCALTEMAGTWEEAVRRWHATHRLEHGDVEPGDALAVYQTIAGAWPLDADRLVAATVKSAREAGLRTSWSDPTPAYEGAIEGFVRRLLGDAGFVAELEEVLAELVPAGRRVSLAWTALRLLCPGVSDTYQGCELWDLSLVDPDNRRPVDFDVRAGLLGDALALEPDGLLARADDGLPKLAVVARGLDLRRRRPELFGPDGAYTPLLVEGPAAQHLVAAARGAVSGAVVLAPRLTGSLPPGGWEGTAVTLPAGRWRSLLGGADVDGGPGAVAPLLGPLGVALLERVGSAPGPAPEDPR